MVKKYLQIVEHLKVLVKKEYLRYSAAHSTIILQNTNISEIKEGNPHIKFPQSVVFRKETNNEKKYLRGLIMDMSKNLTK